MFLHLYMSVHTSILQLDLSRILGTSVLFVSVLCFFFCSKGVLEFEVMYENFVSKNKNTPRFLLLFNYCRCSFQTKLLSANCRLVSYQQRVCVHGVCLLVGLLLVVIDSCFHDKISSPHFYDQFNFENSQCFFMKFFFFLLTRFFLTLHL